MFIQRLRSNPMKDSRMPFNKSFQPSFAHVMHMRAQNIPLQPASVIATNGTSVPVDKKNHFAFSATRALRNESGNLCETPCSKNAAAAVGCADLDISSNNATAAITATESDA